MNKHELDALSREAERLQRLVRRGRQLVERATCQRASAAKLERCDEVHGLDVLLTARASLRVEVSPEQWRAIREVLVRGLREDAERCECTLAYLTSDDADEMLCTNSLKDIHFVKNFNKTCPLTTSKEEHDQSKC